MFPSKLILLWFLRCAHRIAATTPKYPGQKVNDLVLETNSEKQQDLTECLGFIRDGMKSEKLQQCLEYQVYVEACDFHLYPKCTAKRKCLNYPVKLNSNSNIKKIRFNHRRKLVVIVHGTSENYTGSWQQTAKKNLLDNHNVNVLMMDWRSKVECFPVTLPRGLVVLAEIFGRKLGDLLTSFIKVGLKQSNIHLVGHGLGAQITAFAGKYLKTKNKTIGRITGLDPIGVVFNTEPTKLRVDKTDAKFVDCIFTVSPEIAMVNPVCKANFYPHSEEKIKSEENSSQRLGKAAVLFAESSIPSHKFHVRKCAKKLGRGAKPSHCKQINGTALMGYPAGHKLQGIFHVEINGQYPFSAEIKHQNMTTLGQTSETKKPKNRGRGCGRFALALKIFDAESALVKKLPSFAWGSSLNLAKCLLKAKAGYKAVLECMISKAFIKDCDFYLYQKNAASPQKLNIANIQSQTKNVDKNKNVVFLIHGVTVSYTSAWLQQSKTDLLTHYDVNVFAMDWRSKIDHVLVASNVGLPPLAKVFGKKAAEFILALLKAGWDISRIHVVGHSLGGQIAAFAGKMLKRAQKTLPRITGIDPAGLTFDNQPPSYCIGKNDAKFVDCIFTSSPVIALRRPVCTANFYANCYGKEQPGTGSNLMGGATTLSHRRAALLFSESILPSHKFYAKKCEKLPCRGTHPDDCVALNPPALMGYPAATNLTGIFYVKTRASPPYALDALDNKKNREV